MVRARFKLNPAVQKCSGHLPVHVQVPVGAPLETLAELSHCLLTKMEWGYAEATKATAAAWISSHDIWMVTREWKLSVSAFAPHIAFYLQQFDSGSKHIGESYTRVKKERFANIGNFLAHIFKLRNLHHFSPQ